ncbi:hypothetical protein DPV78_005064 [Talaromyces pinophilus]|nr:hypothetical protein DPV78_005064 [Talaromyces pinophilus]
MQDRDDSHRNRIACAVCRGRKLKCDKEKPRCGICLCLGKDCTYEGGRKKSGPKGKPLRELDTRLTKLQALLKEKHSGRRLSSTLSHVQENKHETAVSDHMNSLSSRLPQIDNYCFDVIRSHEVGLEASWTDHMLIPENDYSGSSSKLNLIGLTPTEQFPSWDVTSALDVILFDKVYPTIPILHRRRFFLCSISDRYYSLHHDFYQRARQYAEVDEMNWLWGGDNDLISMPSMDSHIHASRSSLMLGLNRLDGLNHDIKFPMPSPTDWVEKEERRRVFWMANDN